MCNCFQLPIAAAAAAAAVIIRARLLQLPIGGSVLHLFSSRSVLSTSGENAPLMLNSLRISSGVLSVGACACVHKKKKMNHATTANIEVVYTSERVGG